jgi:hypothetical protein
MRRLGHRLHGLMLRASAALPSGAGTAATPSAAYGSEEAPWVGWGERGPSWIFIGADGAPRPSHASSRHQSPARVRAAQRRAIPLPRLVSRLLRRRAAPHPLTAAGFTCSRLWTLPSRRLALIARARRRPR